MGVTLAELLLARRRGLGELIEALKEGDPVAWGIVLFVAVIMVGSFLYKRKKAKEEAAALARRERKAPPPEE